MARPLRTVTALDATRIEQAHQMLGDAMVLLRAAGAYKAAAYVGRSRKSTWGALQHCQRVVFKEQQNAPSSTDPHPSAHCERIER